MEKSIHTVLKSVLLLSTCLLVFLAIIFNPFGRTSFQSFQAFSYLTKMQGFGPRIPGSTAHENAQNYIINTLRQNGWTVELQSGQMSGLPYHNILAWKGKKQISILLGSHYDSRMKADHDKDEDFQDFPVPGSNDGGSSTAVLLELSRILPEKSTKNIGFVFFDLEDQGDLNGYEWILGSREFIKNNRFRPEKMILFDMVGGYIQTIQPPSNSDEEIYESIFNSAKNLGYENFFLTQGTGGILDDHVPFLDAGIPSVDLIDIIDPGWHTAHDDLENVNLISLQRIGDTLYNWLLCQ